MLTVVGLFCLGNILLLPWPFSFGVCAQCVHRQLIARRVLGRPNIWNLRLWTFPPYTLLLWLDVQCPLDFGLMTSVPSVP